MTRPTDKKHAAARNSNKQKPLYASVDLIEKIKHLKRKQRSSKLTSDGKMALKRALDEFESIQANRRKAKMPPLIEDFMQIPTKKHASETQKMVQPPPDPYPYAPVDLSSDDDGTLPEMPPPAKAPKESLCSEENSAQIDAALHSFYAALDAAAPPNTN